MKRNLRILGIDDSPFLRHDETCFLVGVIMRLDFYIEGFVMKQVHVDGNDAQDIIVEMVESRSAQGCNVIMTNGITFGGFNIIDPQALYERLKKPVITITNRSPDMETIKAAISKHLHSQSSIDLIDRLSIEEIQLSPGHLVYMNRAGISAVDARSLVRKTIRQGAVPEPLRMAHLIGRLVKFGYSGKIIPGT
ncbi:MAG: DUF99 family protein [Candidatus Thermoplasmatota archaeon]|nr:DUF99 family protein [Candidatus Thermoplasmatota archaeon]